MLSCHQSAHLTETKALGDWIFPRKVTDPKPASFQTGDAFA